MQRQARSQEYQARKGDKYELILLLRLAEKFQSHSHCFKLPLTTQGKQNCGDSSYGSDR
jgi:hypothetical protein